jgi:hypothetical protein
MYGCSTDPFASLGVGSTHGTSMAGMSTSAAQSAFTALRNKFGNTKVKDANEMQEIMQLVSAYLSPDSWQYCTINAWLTGTPSEDDLNFFGNYFTEMPRLEDVCGDHVWLWSQFKEAFDDLEDAGASPDFVKWINVKGMARRYKVKQTDDEGSDNFDKAITDAKNAVAVPAIGVGTLIAVALIAVLIARTAPR